MLLEPERRVPVRPEVLRRQLRQLGRVLGRVLQELVVHRLEDERDPADAALDRDHLQRGEPVEDPGEHGVDHDAGVVEEQHRAADRGLDVLVLRRPEVLAVEVHRGVAGADVEVHRHVEIGAHLPERVPRAVGQVGGAEVLRVGRHVDAPQAEARAALGLLHAQVDVPRGHDRHREEPEVRLVLHLGHGVVVDLDAQHPQRRVLRRRC